jgi:hypothetical protein
VDGSRSFRLTKGGESQTPRFIASARIRGERELFGPVNSGLQTELWGASRRGPFRGSEREIEVGTFAAAPLWKGAFVRRELLLSCRCRRPLRVSNAVPDPRPWRPSLGLHHLTNHRLCTEYELRLTVTSLPGLTRTCCRRTESSRCSEEVATVSPIPEIVLTGRHPSRKQLVAGILGSFGE